ncbi:MAG: VOC family protein [Anaerolineae bacterium]|nr:VOC family protein [Anaerolineae bacterium]
MSQLVSYLHFDGNCRDAFAFYQECFGGELSIQLVGESPMAGHMPPELHNRVLHASLTSGSIALMGSDMLGAEGLVIGNGVSLCLVCSSKEDITRFFDKLSQGGRVEHPLKEEFFGTFGDLVDRYGYGWMLQYSGGA